MNEENRMQVSIEYLTSIETSMATVGIRKDEILEIRFKLNDYEVDVNEQLEIHDAFVKLTKNGIVPYHILVVSGKNGSVTKEAREMEMFETVAFKNHYSLAIVVNGLPQRILGSLYLSLRKSKAKYPHKLFSTEESAIEWILKEKKI